MSFPFLNKLSSCELDGAQFSVSVVYMVRSIIFAMGALFKELSVARIFTLVSYCVEMGSLVCMNKDLAFASLAREKDSYGFWFTSKTDMSLAIKLNAR